MAVHDSECLISIILWKNREPEQSTLYQIDIKDKEVTNNVIGSLICGLVHWFEHFLQLLTS